MGNEKVNITKRTGDLIVENADANIKRNVSKSSFRIGIDGDGKMLVGIYTGNERLHLVPVENVTIGGVQLTAANYESLTDGLIESAGGGSGSGGDVSAAINAHNISPSSHQDIRDEISTLDGRVTGIENLGNFAGSFDTYADVPANSSSFTGLTVNDFITVRADETHGGATTRYIASAIAPDGTVTWAYDVTYSTDVSGKVDEVPAGTTVPQSRVSGGWQATEETPVNFTPAAARDALTPADSVKTLFGKVTKWFTDLKDLAFKDKADYNTDLLNQPDLTQKLNVSEQVKLIQLVNHATPQPLNFEVLPMVDYLIVDDTLNVEVAVLSVTDTKGVKASSLYSINPLSGNMGLNNSLISANVPYKAYWDGARWILNSLSLYRATNAITNSALNIPSSLALYNLQQSITEWARTNGVTVKSADADTLVNNGTYILLYSGSSHLPNNLTTAITVVASADGSFIFQFGMTLAVATENGNTYYRFKYGNGAQFTAWKRTLTNLDDTAIRSAIPTRTSQLTNDSVFVRELLSGSNVTVSRDPLDPGKATVSVTGIEFPDKFTSTQTPTGGIGDTLSGLDLTDLTGLNTTASITVNDVVIFENGIEAEITDIDSGANTYDAIIVNVIPAAAWGNITGTLANQADLKAVIDAINASIAGKADTATVAIGLDGKVDKVTGMGLSQNNFDNTYKSKLDWIGSATETTIAGMGIIRQLTIVSLASSQTLSIASASVSNAAFVIIVNATAAVTVTMPTAASYVNMGKASYAVASGGVIEIHGFYCTVDSKYHLAVLEKS